MPRQLTTVLRPTLFLIVLCQCFTVRAGVVLALDPEVEPRNTLTLQAGAGRYGGPALEVRSDPAAGASCLFEEPRLLVAPNRYRVEAWVKATGHSPKISLVQYDASTGDECRRYSLVFLDDSNRADSGAKWRYGACDLAWEDEHKVFPINIELSAHGKDFLVDSLSVVGLDSLVSNGDFTAIEAASEEKDVINVPRGWRRKYGGPARDKEAEGSFLVEKTERGSMLLVQKSEGAFALLAMPMTAPGDVQGFAARATLAASSDLMPSLALLQYGRQGLQHECRATKVLRLPGETILSTGPVEREPSADRIHLLLRFPREAGAYRVRSVEVVALGGQDADLTILVDQVGYDSSEPFRFIVATQLFPTSGIGEFSMKGAGAQTYTGPLVALGRAVGQDAGDWGAYYFEGVVKGLAPGTYALQATLGNQAGSLDSITVGPQLRLHETGEPAYRFYSVQRCGCEVSGWHGPCHMDDAILPDGTHVDVTGGYHNAGDYHKHMDDNTPVSVYGMVSAYAASKDFFDGIDRDKNARADLLDEAIWGAEWLRKMVNPKTGHIWMNVTNDIDYYGIPENDTDGIVGTGDDRVIGTADPWSLGAFTIAAWAVLSRHIPDTTYLHDAEKLWAVYEDRILGGHNPRHVFSALELYQATGNETYLSAAKQVTHNLFALQDEEGWFAQGPGGGPMFRIVDEGTIPAALARFALEQPDSELGRRARECVKRYFHWSFTMGDNPFGVIRHRADGQPFYFKGRDGWFGGNNSAYCSVAWAAYLASRVFQDEPDFSRLLQAHATNQIRWILGMNPLNLCMFEGKGNSERIRYYHLYAEIPGHHRGAVPGAIPNGIIREPGNADRPWFDLRTGTGTLPCPESAEPWLPHNAYYLLMLSAM